LLTAFILLVLAEKFNSRKLWVDFGVGVDGNVVTSI